MKFSCARNVVVVALACSTLAGCFDDTKATGQVQTVEWFKANNDDRKAVLQKCDNNPGELMGTPNCVNALKASKDLSVGEAQSYDFKLKRE